MIINFIKRHLPIFGNDPKSQGEWKVIKDGRWGISYIDHKGSVKIEAELMPLSGSWFVNTRSINEWVLNGQSHPISENERQLIILRVKEFFYKLGVVVHTELEDIN